MVPNENGVLLGPVWPYDELEGWGRLRPAWGAAAIAHVEFHASGLTESARTTPHVLIRAGLNGRKWDSGLFQTSIYLNGKRN